MERFKILIVSEGMAAVGGIATYIRLLARNLTLRHHEVAYLATNYKGDGFEELSRSIPCIDVSHVPLTWRKPIIAARLINTIQPHLVISNHSSLLQYSLPLIKRPTKTLVILHSHDRRFYGTAVRNRRYVFRWVAPSPALASSVKSYVSPRQEERIRTIPHAIDDKIFFTGNAALHRPKHVAFVGYIAPNKGADLLPALMEGVVTKHPDALLHVVGHGPMRESLEIEFAQRGLLKNVKFTGPLPSDEVAVLLRSVRVFVLPTRIEGFGLAIAEAMMCGAVPVVTRLQGITDQIVDDAVSGFLCNADQVESFSSRVNQLLFEHSSWREFSEMAARNAASRFSVRPAMDRYEAVFREPLGSELPWTASLAGWAIQTAWSNLAERIGIRFVRNEI